METRIGIVTTGGADGASISIKEIDASSNGATGAILTAKNISGATVAVNDRGVISRDLDGTLSFFFKSSSGGSSPNRLFLKLEDVSSGGSSQYFWFECLPSFASPLNLFPMGGTQASDDASQIAGIWTNTDISGLQLGSVRSQHFVTSSLDYTGNMYLDMTESTYSVRQWRIGNDPSSPPVIKSAYNDVNLILTLTTTTATYEFKITDWSEGATAPADNAPSQW